MKVEIFVPVSYYGPVDKAWPTPPRCYDPQIGMQSMEWGMQQCEAAFTAGFDSLNFAEHHYSVNQLSPSPIFYAGLLGQRLPDAQIGVLGSDLPLHNPVQLAEEYSMLDNLLGGRLTHRPASRHAERVHDLRHEPVGLEGGVQGGRAPVHPRAHRARAVRVGGPLLPLPQRVDLAAATPASASADLVVGQQSGLGALRR